MTDQPDTAPQPAPPHWIEALDRAEADLASGRVSDGGEVRQRLRASIERMQADADAKAATGR